jgi:hypothetical protein
VDAPLDYILLLGRNWTYAMIALVSSVFCTLCFPHKGKIVTIEQLSFAYSSPNASLGQSIPVINNSRPATENVSVGMYSSLMGTFDFSTSNHQVYAMSSRPVSTGRSIPFRTSYFDDAWTLPSSTLSCKGQSHVGMAMPLSAIKIVYQAVLDSSTDPRLRIKILYHLVAHNHRQWYTTTAIAVHNYCPVIHNHCQWYTITVVSHNYCPMIHYAAIN